MPTISAAAIHQILDHEQQQAQPPKYHSSFSSSSAARPHDKPAFPFPWIIDDDDPILDFPSEKWIASMIGNTGLLYRFSSDLIYKTNVTPREADLTESAGSDLTMRLLSRVIWSGSRPDEGTKAVIMEAGKLFRGSRIPEQKRPTVAVEMFRILEKLHGRGIVHGNVRESNFLWSRKDGRLRIVDFSCARLIEEDAGRWNSKHVSSAYMTPARLAVREERQPQQQGAQGGGGPGQPQKPLPAPTVFDDYYALAITLWAFYTGKPPGSRQFNQVNIKRSDLAEVRDDMIRGWIRKVFRMAGCKFVAPPSDPHPRRETKGGVQGQLQEQEQLKRQQRHSSR